MMYVHASTSTISAATSSSFKTYASYPTEGQHGGNTLVFPHSFESFQQTRHKVGVSFCTDSKHWIMEKQNTHTNTSYVQILIHHTCRSYPSTFITCRRIHIRCYHGTLVCIGSSHGKCTWSWLRMFSAARGRHTRFFCMCVYMYVSHVYARS